MQESMVWDDDDEYDAIMLEIDENVLSMEKVAGETSSTKVDVTGLPPISNSKIDKETIIEPPGGETSSTPENSPLKPLQLRLANSTKVYRPTPRAELGPGQSRWDVFKNKKEDFDNGGAPTKPKSNAELHREYLQAEEAADKTIDVTTMSLLKKALQLTDQDKADIIFSIKVKWVRENATQLNLSSKIPLLVVCVKKNVPNQNCITVMDDSGSRIVATLDEDAIHKFKNKLTVGSSVALLGCSIMTFRRNVTIVVGEKNIICIATKATLENGDVGLPTWSDYVFCRKPDKNGVSLLQFAALDYDEIEEQNLNLLKERSLAAERNMESYKKLKK